jgi:hypothetical protein
MCATCSARAASNQNATVDSPAQLLQAGGDRKEAWAGWSHGGDGRSAAVCLGAAPCLCLGIATERYASGLGPGLPRSDVRGLRSVLLVLPRQRVACAATCQCDTLANCPGHLEGIGGISLREGASVPRLAGVAQSVEHLICNQRVGGSNPFASSRVEAVCGRERSASPQPKSRAKRGNSKSLTEFQK